MADSKTNYRITIRRPIDGRMRNVGEVVALTAREYAAEAGWGGLEPVKDEAVAAPETMTAPHEPPPAEMDAVPTISETSGKRRR